VLLPCILQHQGHVSLQTGCFANIGYIIAHIYKLHSACPSCSRCYSTFSTDEDLRPHTRVTPACEVRNRPRQIDGLDENQTKQLKRRDRKSVTDVERWQLIYQICFPQDEHIPTPC